METIQRITLTRKEAAALLGVAVGTLDESRKCGTLPGSLGKNIRKKVVYSRKLLENWLNSVETWVGQC